jgi:hypothetical protein
MRFLNRNSNKTIKKIEITSKRLEIGIHINIVALKLNFTFMSSVRNGSYHLKNEVFDIFQLHINFEKLQFEKKMTGEKR